LRRPRPGAFHAAHASQMLAQLRRQTLRRVYPSFASPRFMRQFRLRFCGAVLAMLRTVPDREIRFYTLVPHAWRNAGDQLATVSPKKLLEQFRAQFNRAGGAGHSGVLIAFVHGEYDPRTDAFQLHLHVLTVGGKAKAIEKLRNSPVYQVSKHVHRPIVKRKVRNRARQVSYHVAQGFWPAKPTALVNRAVVERRMPAQATSRMPYSLPHYPRAESSPVQMQSCGTYSTDWGLGANGATLGSRSNFAPSWVAL
jgi:hypothetical protein